MLNKPVSFDSSMMLHKVGSGPNLRQYSKKFLGGLFHVVLCIDEDLSAAFEVSFNAKDVFPVVTNRIEELPATPFSPPFLNTPKGGCT